MIHDFQNVKGWVDIVLRDAVTGEIKAERHNHNLITTVGHEHMADQMSDQGEAQVGWMAVGTGTGQSQASTTLANELDRNALQSGPTQSTDSVEYVGFWAAGDGTGAITEAGLFNAGAAGTMLAYEDFAVINKGANDTLTITWTIQFTST